MTPTTPVRSCTRQRSTVLGQADPSSGRSLCVRQAVWRLLAVDVGLSEVWSGELAWVQQEPE